MKRKSDLPRFVLTRCLSLCVLLLLCTRALLLRAGQGGAGGERLREYAEVFQFSALVAFGGGLWGACSWRTSWPIMENNLFSLLPSCLSAG